MSDSAIDVLSEKIKTIHECVDSLERKFENFTVGLGKRVEDHQNRIVRVETSLALLEKACWILFSATMVVVIASFWKLVLR